MNAGAIKSGKHGLGFGRVIEAMAEKVLKRSMTEWGWMHGIY